MTTILSEEEIKQVSELMTSSDMKEVAQSISILIQALEGKDVSGEDKISKLTNPNEIMERSRYPTYTLLNLIVYLKNVFKMNPNAESCDAWANKLSQALISYKGQGREEYVEMTKAISPMPEQVFSLNPRQQEQSTIKKAHFWSKSPKNQDAEEMTES